MYGVYLLGLCIVNLVAGLSVVTNPGSYSSTVELVDNATQYMYYYVCSTGELTK